MEQSEGGSLSSGSDSEASNTAEITPSLESNGIGTEPKRTLRVLYLFAGVSRKADIRECLTEICAVHSVSLQFIEIDLVRDPSHDVSDDDIWETLLAQVRSHCFDFVLVTPPCSTWSRACYSKQPGPPPVRSADYPWGLPWLKGALRDKAELGS